MKPGDMVEMANAHRYAEDTNDLDTAMSTYHDQCFYEVVTEDVRIDGKENIRRMYEAGDEQHAHTSA